MKIPPWLDPFKILIFLLMPIYLYASYQDFSIYGVRDYTGSAYYYLGLGLLVSIFFGAVVGSKMLVGRNVHGIHDLSYASLKRFLLFFFWAFLFLSVTGYIIWFGGLIANPRSAIEVVFGTNMNVREEISTKPGITTLTQFGPLLSVVAAFIFGMGMDRGTAIYKSCFGVFLFLVLIRTVLWSERLALIEVMIPFVVVAFLFARKEEKIYWIYKKGLIFVVIVLLIVFGVFEYFRSWDYYKESYNVYLVFLIERLAAYYTLSINNGIGFLEEYNGWPLITGDVLFSFIYKIPFLREDEYSSTLYFYNNFLRSYLRPEFNNWTAIFSVVADVGFFISFFLYFLYGMFLGISYSRFKRKSIIFSFVYPFALLSLYELFRFSYFSSSRSTYIVVGLIWMFIFGLMMLKKNDRLSMLYNEKSRDIH